MVPEVGLRPARDGGKTHPHVAARSLVIAYQMVHSFILEIPVIPSSCHSRIRVGSPIREYCMSETPHWGCSKLAFAKHMAGPVTTWWGTRVNRELAGLA